MVHNVIDVAEKVLLPSMKRQPGNSPYKMCLNFRLLATSSGNLRTNLIFGLLEGHLQEEKKAIEVISML